MSWWKRLVQKGQELLGASVSGPVGDGCDHSSIKLREGTAEFEWFIARGELEMGNNLAHGAKHLSNLLTFAPGNPEWVELLERYLAAAPDAEALIPRGDKLYYGTEAMRAYIWHKQGRLQDAVQLLVDVTQAKPEARYLEAWALGWLEPAGVIESLPEPLGLQLFALVLSRFPEAKQLPLPRLREVLRWARLSQRHARQYPGDPTATMLRAGVLRKAGLFDDAIALVQPSANQPPNWHRSTALGLALREKGDWQAAETAFKQALQADPSDISARLEAGDMFCERQDWNRALNWYENALTKDRKHPWAQPSAIYCEWKRTGDEQRMDELVALAKKGNQRAHQLCGREFWGGLPQPADATANMLRQFRDSIRNDPAKAPSGEAQMTLSCLEVPSNYLAFRMEMAALKHDLRLTVSVEAIPKPDPRRPISDVKYLLWQYRGTDAVPALPPPPDDVAQAIARLAAAPFDEPVNWAAASRVAEKLGPGRVSEILATMVHPPAVPDGTDALTWLPRVQLAAAQVVGQLGDGWDGTARREGLLSVLHGPQDWATEAAIRVLGRLGCDYEPIAPAIGDAFAKLADHRPDRGHVCWERTLYRTWLDLPHLFPGERKELEGMLRAVEEE